VETTGLDNKKDKIVEIGCKLYDFKNNTSLGELSLIVRPKGEYSIHPEAEKLHGINANIIEKYGFSTEIWEIIKIMATKADAFMAHNALFDQGFLQHIDGIFKDKPWINTMTDISYPPNITTRKLTYIAAEHGIVNPNAHRALDDVNTMILIARNYDIDILVKRSNAKTITIQAIVNFDNKQKAKDARFRWDANNKRWIKEIKDFELEDLKKSVEFEIKEIK
jgi:DNA polymerase-3 subunit epsilon